MVAFWIFILLLVVVAVIYGKLLARRSGAAEGRLSRSAARSVSRPPARSVSKPSRGSVSESGKLKASDRMARRVLAPRRDLRPLLLALDPECIRAVQQGVEDAMETGAFSVETEHVVLALVIESGTSFATAVRRAGVDSARLVSSLDEVLGALRTQQSTKLRPTFAPKFGDWLAEASALKDEIGVEKVHGDTLFAALIRVRERVVAEAVLRELEAVDLDAAMVGVVGPKSFKLISPS